MKIKDLAMTLKLETASAGNLERDVNSAYASDLLSRVMTNVEANSVWITVHGHVNVAAVAMLADVAGVIITEGTEPDPLTVKKAVEEGITIFKTEMKAYELCWRIHDLLL